MVGNSGPSSIPVRTRSRPRASYIPHSCYPMQVRVTLGDTRRQHPTFFLAWPLFSLAKPRLVADIVRHRVTVADTQFCYPCRYPVRLGDMATGGLTPIAIGNMKPKAKRYEVPDRRSPGLYIAVQPG